MGLHQRQVASLIFFLENCRAFNFFFFFFFLISCTPSSLMVVQELVNKLSVWDRPGTLRGHPLFIPALWPLVIDLIERQLHICICLVLVLIGWWNGILDINHLPCGAKILQIPFFFFLRSQKTGRFFFRLVSYLLVVFFCRILHSVHTL